MNPFSTVCLPALLVLSTGRRWVRVAGEGSSASGLLPSGYLNPGVCSISSESGKLPRLPGLAVLLSCHPLARLCLLPL